MSISYISETMLWICWNLQHLHQSVGK